MNLFSGETKGSRKIIITFVTMAAGIGAVALKGDVPTNFLTLLQTLAGAFVVGNGVEHAARAMKKDASAGAPLVVDVPGVGTALGQLEDQASTLEAISNGVQTSNQALAFLVEYVKRASGN